MFIIWENETARKEDIYHTKSIIFNGSDCTFWKSIQWKWSEEGVKVLITGQHSDNCRFCENTATFPNLEIISSTWSQGNKDPTFQQLNPSGPGKILVTNRLVRGQLMFLWQKSTNTFVPAFLQAMCAVLIFLKVLHSWICLIYVNKWDSTA